LARQDELGRWQPLQYPKAARYAHIHYALSNDDRGIAVGCTPHLVPVERRDVVTGAMETVHAPWVHFRLVPKVPTPTSSCASAALPPSICPSTPTSGRIWPGGTRFSKCYEYKPFLDEAWRLEIDEDCEHCPRCF
jgi:hypothetical protein